MTWTRRSFLGASSAALASATLGVHRANAATSRAMFAEMPPLGSPDLKALALRALDAARGAGATYADVQLRTVHHRQLFAFATWWGPYPQPWERYSGGIGVRALVNGYWGFSGMSGVATADQMAALGREAAAQARMAGPGTPRTMELAPVTVVRDAHWATPVEIDPFTVSPDEVIDFCTTVLADVNAQRYTNDLTLGVEFFKDERTFASTEGSFISQTLHTTGGTFNLNVERAVTTEQDGGWSADFLTPAGAGWEYIIHAPIQEQLPELLEHAFVGRRRSQPVEVGRYNVVFDAHTTAILLDKTIGAATELDRAMGFEANGIGTSFLNDPLAMVGSYKIGSPLVTVTANRTASRGAATVGWDDEGVSPLDTKLVTQGVLTDFQTTRESASWLSPYNQRLGRPTRSNGCAGAESVTLPLAQVPPNFALAPASHSASFDDLVRETKTGIAVMMGSGDVDQQALNGSGLGVIREITNGVLGGPIFGARYLYRAPNFWQNVTAIGGPESVLHLGLARDRRRGRPQAWHTVSAVPVAVQGVAIANAMSRA